MLITEYLLKHGEQMLKDIEKRSLGLYEDDVSVYVDAKIEELVRELSESLNLPYAEVVMIVDRDYLENKVKLELL